VLSTLWCDADVSIHSTFVFAFLIVAVSHLSQKEFEMFHFCVAHYFRISDIFLL
jgi:hypothetical protein